MICRQTLRHDKLYDSFVNAYGHCLWRLDEHEYYVQNCGLLCARSCRVQCDHLVGLGMHWVHEE